MTYFEPRQPRQIDRVFYRGLALGPVVGIIAFGLMALVSVDAGALVGFVLAPAPTVIGFAVATGRRGLPEGIRSVPVESLTIDRGPWPQWLWRSAGCFACFLGTLTFGVSLYLLVAR